METEGTLPHSKCPSPIPILSQISPVHAPHSLPEDPFCYYPPIYAQVFQVVSCLRFPNKILYTPVFSSKHATCPAHLILLDSMNRILFCGQYRSLSISLCSLLHSLVTSSLFSSTSFLSTLFSSNLSLRSSLMRQTKFHIHKKQPDIRTSCSLTYAFQMGGQSETSVILLSHSRTTEIRISSTILCQAQCSCQVICFTSFNEGKQKSEVTECRMWRDRTIMNSDFTKVTE